MRGDGMVVKFQPPEIRRIDATPATNVAGTLATTLSLDLTVQQLVSADRRKRLALPRDMSQPCQGP